MAQDRLFHKRLGHGERVNQLSDFEYIVWSCYVLSADDYGVMRCSAITLQADHDRLATKSPGAIERALSKAVQLGLLKVFDHQGRRYVCQLDWQDFQKIRYPAKSHNPVPPDEILQQMSALTADLFRERTETLPKDSGKVSETFRAPRSRQTALSHGNANGNANENVNGNAAHLPAETGRMLMDLWNSVTHAPLPQCRELSPDRRRRASSRLSERPLDAWREVFDRIQRSSFCRGEGGDRGWVATFDWAIKSADVAIRVLEGKYDDRDPSASAPTNKRIAGLMAGGQAFLKRSGTES